ncbi:hypothetical protein LR002_00015, partial [Candidatus Gracilibacteria bacterium]|nr:hypothetical protein [Candidatus Gracilibacteria bacterium]
MKNKKIHRKFFANILLFAMFFNVLGTNIFAQKNEAYLKHDSTNYLDFGNFNLKINDDYSIDNTNGAFLYPDGASGTGDVSLKYGDKFNVKIGRKVTANGYVFVLSGWIYDTNLGWIQVSHDTKSNNTQDPVNQNTALIKDINQLNGDFGAWIDQNGILYGKGKVDADSTFASFTGANAFSPKPFDIDGDGLLNNEEAQIFLGQNNVGDIDGDGFTDGERDWDSDGDGYNDKDDPFPMDPNEPGTGYTIPTDNSCDSGIDSDGDGINNDIECNFGLDSGDAT